MSKFKIITQKAPDEGDNNYEMESLDPIGAEIIEISFTTEEEFLNVARDADGIIARHFPISKNMIDGLEKCKIIACGSVGTDNVDVPAATERGIPVVNVPDTFVDEVADHTMTMILATWRRLPLMDRMVRDGRWDEGRPVLYEFPRLMGQTLGFISFGHIPRAVSRRAAPFGFNMLAYDPYIEEMAISNHGVEPVVLEELLERSDIVSMHAPGMEDTDQMMKEKHFRLMKPTALFINNGRGSTVDEPALIRALEEGQIAGAGLDVFAKEPPDSENPLLHMENVVVTPHAASASARFHPQRRRRLGQELALVLNGKWPRACVNPSVLATSSLTRWQPYSMERGPAR